MKKNFMIAIVAAVAISFSACNSGTDTKKTDDAAATPAVEAPAPAAETSASNGTIDKYAELVEKMIAVQEKAKTGDAAALQEMSTLAQEAANMATEIQKELPNMTAEQKAKFEELAQKLVASAQQK